MNQPKRKEPAWAACGIKPPPVPGREAADWKYVGCADFPGMLPAEKAVLEIRLAATREMEHLRVENPISQEELARRMGTKQPNVSKLFKNPGKATLDTLFRALFALGSTPRKIAALFESCPL
jgi:predicted XRE-type DNA-binding protein